MKTTNGTEQAKAYVDGSFSPKEAAFAYGAVLFWEGRTYTRCGKRMDEDLISMRNVAGEIVAAWRAMQFCVEHGIPRLELYYDYEGIEKWCTGVWKANRKGTQAYRNYYLKQKDRLEVSFVKVRAHTGVTFNEMADRLAKKALAEGSSDGWTLEESVTED